MQFENLTQIIWLIIAAIFVLSSLLLVCSESTCIYVHSESYGKVYLKINKITGRTHILVPAKSGKWHRIPNIVGTTK